VYDIVPSEAQKLGNVLKFGGKVDLAKLSPDPEQPLPSSISITCDIGIVSSQTVVYSMTVTVDLAIARRKKLGLAPNGEQFVTLY